jgi:hypothetical protein
MKDPCSELVSAIITLLGSTLTYQSYLFSVYDDLPEKPTNRYVWFPRITCSDDSTQDTFRLNTVVTMQVVTRGMTNKASRAAITGIGTIILTAIIRKSLTLTNFATSEKPRLISIDHGTAFNEDGSLTLTGDYTFELVVQQT